MIDYVLLGPGGINKLKAGEGIAFDRAGDLLSIRTLAQGQWLVTEDFSTGAQNDWHPGCPGWALSDMGDNALIEWKGTADVAITGIADGASGRLRVFKNKSTKIATFANNSGSSLASARLRNLVTSAPTPVAPEGWIAYQHDGTEWQLVGHEQGAWIRQPYAAGDFVGSGFTWTVDAGDVAEFSYVLKGRTLTVTFSLQTTTIGAAPTASVSVTIPGGFVATIGILGTAGVVRESGGLLAALYIAAGATGTTLGVVKIAETAYIVGVNNTDFFATTDIQVT